MMRTVYWIDALPGHLGIMPHPPGGEALADAIASLRRSGVALLVSLLAREEIVALDLLDEEALCAAGGIDYRWLPIGDWGVPALREDAVIVMRNVLGMLCEGRSVVLHCHQGIGRSGMIAAAVLIAGGLAADDAFGRLSSARGHTVPETPEQRAWSAAFAPGELD